MGETTNVESVRNDSTEIRWDPCERIARVSYTPGTRLKAADAVFLTNALTGWIGTSGEPFAVLIDGAGLHGTGMESRRHASRFFRQHRDTSCIALINLGPLIQVVVEMFRVGTGIRIKACGSEAEARTWMRTMGIAA